jgi:heme A synthase
LLHRYWALVVVGAVLQLGYATYQSAGAFRLARSTALTAVALVLVQFALGVLTVQSVRNPFITSVHVVVGAMLLGVTVLTALRAWMPANSGKTDVNSSN